MVTPSITITSPARDSRVRGVVTIRARVLGGSATGDVKIVIGMPQIGTVVATRASKEWYTFSWDTTKKVLSPGETWPSDALFWLSATATIAGVAVRAPLVPVYTANRPVTVPQGGWRPELAWSANYSDMAAWTRSLSGAVGSVYAELGADNTRSRSSSPKSVTVAMPNAVGDSDQPNDTTVRFQAQGRRNIVEGDEFCVGFAFKPSEDFPTVYPRDDPANPRGRDATGYIALFQFYGPPYEQGSPFVLHANRPEASDPLDEFVIRGNELNPGDPYPFLSIPYNRGRWTDIVFRVRASKSIEAGWVETYVNQGESQSVQILPFANGMTRVPRVLLRAASQAFRTDMQIYRVANRFDLVTVTHGAHRVARTVEEADPRSYA